MHQWPYSIFKEVTNHLYDPVDVGLFLLALKHDRSFMAVHSALSTLTFTFGTYPFQRHNGRYLENYAAWKWRQRQHFREAAALQAQLNRHPRFWQRPLVATGVVALMWMALEVALVALFIAVFLKMVLMIRELVELLVEVVQVYGIHIAVAIIVVWIVSFLHRNLWAFE